MALTKDSREFVECLRSNKVDFLIVGALAVHAENRVIPLGLEPNRIDLMTSISGVSFEEAWQSRVIATIDGIELNVIGREALIQNKRASGRPRDLIDVAELMRHTDK